MSYKLSIIIPVYNQEELVIRCLNSIPKRKDVELIITDDCSTDKSKKNIIDWINTNQYFGAIHFKYNDINMGVGYTKSKMYDIATGEYITTIDSDDYVFTDKYSKIIDELYKNHTDNEILILDHEDNNGNITRSNSCNATWRYFIKLKYLRDNNLKINPIYRRAEDWFLMREVEKLKPKFTRLGILAYHYNYPREGSLSWNWDHYRKV